MVGYHQNSLTQALEDLFPKIASQNRRKFFENFAAENRFDSRDPTSWYSQSRQRIMAYPVCIEERARGRGNEGG